MAVLMPIFLALIFSSLSSVATEAFIFNCVSTCTKCSLTHGGDYRQARGDRRSTVCQRSDETGNSDADAAKTIMMNKKEIRNGDDGGENNTDLGETLRKKVTEDVRDVLDESSKFIKNKIEERLDEGEAESLRADAATSLQIAGLCNSVVTSILSDTAQMGKVWKPKLESLREFLRLSGVEEEIAQGLSVHLMDNIKILSHIQETALDGKDPRDDYLSADLAWDDVPPMEEAKLYAKYAVSCYGELLMKAADFISSDIEEGWSLLHDAIRPDPGMTTKKRVANRLGLEENDLVRFHLDYGGKADELRHFIAINRDRKAVVLAIRGTLNLSEVVTDVTGYTKPFLGGESHADMSNMAMKLWDTIKEDVDAALTKYPDYELIITGHSLGGGTANLLNILLHENDNARVHGRKVRCFSYASPPAFAPLSAIPEAIQDAVNYSHEMDEVPFLCGYTIRHLFNSLAVLEEATKTMSERDRHALADGDISPPESLLKQVLAITPGVLPSKEGVGIEYLPVKTSVWIRKTGDTYDTKLCDPKLLATRPVSLDPAHTPDHYPARYELCFKDW